MATRKRRSTKRRRIHARRANPVNPVNPTRRRRRSTKRRHTVHARRHHNPVNPTRRRGRKRYSRRRRSFLRNPLHAAGGEIINFAVGGIGLAMFQPFVQRFAGPYVGALGSFAGPALTAGSGWLLSKIFEQFGFTRRFAHPTLVLGFSTAVIQIVQPVVARSLSGGAPAQTMQGWQPRNWQQRRGMNGIGMTTGVPPTITAPPLPPQGNNSQAMMSGMGVRPGVWGY